MKLCPRCAQQLGDPALFCPACGEEQPRGKESFVPAVAFGAETAAPAEEFYRRAKKSLHIIAYFVWSLLLVLAVNPIGTPIGFVGALIAITANSSGKRPEEAAAEMVLCKRLCVLATIMDSLFLAFFGSVMLFNSHS